MLSLKQAAEYTGHPVKTLRKIIDRSRTKAGGKPVIGPTIRFFQTAPRAPIRFRQEWLDEHIEQYSVNPEAAVALPPKPKKKRPMKVPQQAAPAIDYNLMG